MASVTQQIRSFNRFYTDFLGLLNEHILASPLSLSESRILYELSQNATLTANQIATTLRMDKGYLSRILKKFEKQNLLIKAPSQEDKRVQNLSLSPHGQALFGRINAHSERQVQEQISHLDEPTQQELITLLTKTRHLLAADARPGLKLADITIRTDLRPGDIGFVIFAHGNLYQKEYHYGIAFEQYVAKGMAEFYDHYDPARSRVWIGEHAGQRVGFLLLMDRGRAAQLRYFFVYPEYRQLGLGKKLMRLYMDFLLEKGYTSSYLWTIHELGAAASLYTRHGFRLVEEKVSTDFGKEVIEQRYEVICATLGADGHGLPGE